MKKTILPSLQGILQSADIRKLDIERDKSYIIHSVLAKGTLKEINWLRTMYSDSVIRRVFLNRPSKEYRKARFQLLVNYLLPIATMPLNERLYVINTPRGTGQKTNSLV